MRASFFGIRQNEVKAKGVQNSDQMKVKNAVELSPMLSAGVRAHPGTSNPGSNPLLKFSTPLFTSLAGIFIENC
jgi:hypothetical protein